MEKNQVITGAGTAGVAFVIGLAEAAPTVENLTPLCSGICGSCGGGCIAAVGTVAWISAVAFYKKYRQGADHHE